MRHPADEVAIAGQVALVDRAALVFEHEARDEHDMAVVQAQRHLEGFGRDLHVCPAFARPRQDGA